MFRLTIMHLQVACFEFIWYKITKNIKDFLLDFNHIALMRVYHMLQRGLLYPCGWSPVFDICIIHILNVIEAFSFIFVFLKYRGCFIMMTSLKSCVMWKRKHDDMRFFVKTGRLYVTYMYIYIKYLVCTWFSWFQQTKYNKAFIFRVHVFFGNVMFFSSNPKYSWYHTHIYIHTSSFPVACLRLKRGRFLTLRHMGSPLKNQNFEKRFAAC